MGYCQGEATAAALRTPPPSQVKPQTHALRLDGTSVIWAALVTWWDLVFPGVRPKDVLGGPGG